PLPEWAMEQPVCLVANPADGELEVMEEALEALRGVDQPVVVVAVAGLYRTGKSYLLNQLAGRRTGFSLGSTIQSHTKGIWMWCLPHPHPRRAGHTLVLLDTEGLGDVEKGDGKNDTWIFALAVLLSSILVYNSMGTMNQLAMDQLQYLGLGLGLGLGRFPGSPQSPVDIGVSSPRGICPTAVVLPPRSSCMLAQGCCPAPISSPGSSQQAQLYSLPRECIRQFFPGQKCFVFVQPASRRDLAPLEELQEVEMEPKFREQVARFCHHIWETSKPKTIPSGHVVTRASESW
uniref:GB1/RHD3-type G domain-containing protein n=1 Tax=Gopherus evgoodei TaxID=1825980 RepID=A0A8C4YE96_9SAUR